MISVNRVIVAAALVNEVEGLEIVGEDILNGMNGEDSLAILIFATEPLFL